MTNPLLLAISEFLKYKNLAEKAFEQLTDEQFFRSPDNGTSNSIAMIVKHIAGNLRSRWRDFLTTDGEKPDRYRDTEFELTDDDTRESLMKRWDDGWEFLFDTLDSLTEEDLNRTITIRGEEHTVMQAIMRQLAHYPSHVGQIMYIARMLLGNDWKTLSIAKGKSKEFEEAVRTKQKTMKDIS